MIGEVEWDVCDGFEGVVEVRDSCIDRREGVGHREQRRWLRSTYRRGSSSLSGWTACEVIVPCQGWRYSDCDCALWLLGGEATDREMRYVGVALIEA